MEYDDGGAPPPEIIKRWLEVVQTTFHNAPESSGQNGALGPAIAVHCVAGLGRAPVLVAIALIEHGKASNIHTVLKYPVCQCEPNARRVEPETFDLCRKSDAWGGRVDRANRRAATGDSFSGDRIFLPRLHKNEGALTRSHFAIASILH